MDAIREEEARKKRSDQMRKQRSAVSTDMECQQRFILKSLVHTAAHVCNVSVLYIMRHA